LTDVVGWMCTAPAELAGLQRKGRIALGYDADFAIFAPDAASLVDPRTILHRNGRVTPYAFRAMSGVVRQTWLRGEPIELSAAPRGNLLLRGAA